MTRRASTIRRRTSADQSLCIGVELAAAGMFWGWFRTEEWSTRRFWAAIANAHGERIDAKLREAAPGCRAGRLLGHLRSIDASQPHADGGVVAVAHGDRVAIANAEHPLVGAGAAAAGRASTKRRAMAMALFTGAPCKSAQEFLNG